MGNFGVVSVESFAEAALSKAPKSDEGTVEHTCMVHSLKNNKTHFVPALLAALYIIQIQLPLPYIPD